MVERKKIKIVFMGTPGFAATILQYLADWDGGEVVGVYTQPDRPCGRGQVCKCSEVKELALKLGFDIFQPQNFKSEQDIEILRQLKPDILLVAAYGLILPQAVLDIAPLGAVNVHASLLPKYRGAAPIQRAIVNGDPVTGISIMRMELGLDSGPILLQRSLAIGMDDTAQNIHDQLADMGGRLLVESLDLMQQGKLLCLPQDESLATYASKLEKNEGLVDWNRPAQVIHDQIRGLSPWPGAYFDWQGREKPLRLNLLPGRLGKDVPPGTAPGTIVGLEEDMLGIACQDKIYLMPQIKPAGKKAMTAQGFVCGYLSRCCD